MTAMATRDGIGPATRQLTTLFRQSPISLLHTFLRLLLVHARDDAAINLETLTRKG